MNAIVLIPCQMPISRIFKQIIQVQALMHLFTLGPANNLYKISNDASNEPILKCRYARSPYHIYLVSWVLAILESFCVRKRMLWFLIVYFDFYIKFLRKIRNYFTSHFRMLVSEKNVINKSSSTITQVPIIILIIFWVTNDKIKFALLPFPSWFSFFSKWIFSVQTSTNASVDSTKNSDREIWKKSDCHHSM